MLQASERKLAPPRSRPSTPRELLMESIKQGRRLRPSHTPLKKRHTAPATLMDSFPDIDKDKSFGQELPLDTGMYGLSSCLFFVQYVSLLRPYVIHQFLQFRRRGIRQDQENEMPLTHNASSLPRRFESRYFRQLVILTPEVNFAAIISKLFTMNATNAQISVVEEFALNVCLLLLPLNTWRSPVNLCRDVTSSVLHHIDYHTPTQHDNSEATGKLNTIQYDSRWNVCDLFLPPETKQAFPQSDPASIQMRFVL
ncbi:hypothetical protein C0J52_22367 [Blattella germanica]|nr:hypothetical protein C0J52_22367 [Blattella germanica]